MSAIAAARDNERQQAHEHLARAGEIAERRARTATISVPGPALPMWRSRAAGVAAELGDAGQASELARRVSPGPLSPERPARYDLGLARAHARRRQIGEALSCLEEAERLTPGQIRTHRVARAVARDLI